MRLACIASIFHAENGIRLGLGKVPESSRQYECSLGIEVKIIATVQNNSQYGGKNNKIYSRIRNCASILGKMAEPS
jgi:hypothetical protein